MGARLYIGNMRVINHNGQLLPADKILLPYDSFGLRYGIGVFETMLVENGNIRLAEFHWQRLFSGMEKLRIATDEYTSGQFSHEISRCLQENNFKGRVKARLQIYTGAGSFPDGMGKDSGFIIEAAPLADEAREGENKGWVLGIDPSVRLGYHELKNHKCTGMLPYLLAARRARAAGWQDALLLNIDNHIVESTIANVFWIKDRQIFTPPLSDGCVAGVMRRFMLERSGLDIEEQSVTVSELMEADELFLTNAIRGICRVHKLGEKTYSEKLVKEIEMQIRAQLIRY